MADDVKMLEDPGRPDGEIGKQMLFRMNNEHYPLTSWALSLWNINGTDRILDIGCGGGVTLKRMADSITEGHLTGVDYSPLSIELSAKENADEIASGKTDLVNASVEALPFADKTFDKIITVESFYFWPSPVECLKEVRRVLKPGGTFFLVADINGSDTLRPEEYENIKRYSLFNPTKEEFLSMFEAAGFAESIIHTKEQTTWVCVEGKR